MNETILQRMLEESRKLRWDAIKENNCSTVDFYLGRIDAIRDILILMRTDRSEAVNYD